MFYLLTIIRNVIFWIFSIRIRVNILRNVVSSDILWKIDVSQTLSKSYAVDALQVIRSWSTLPKIHKSYAVNFDPPPTDQSYAVSDPLPRWDFSVKSINFTTCKI